MKKKHRKHLRLNRETLRSLDQSQTERVAGAASGLATDCPGLCLTCEPANCPATDFCGGGGTEFCPPPTNADCGYLTVGPCENFTVYPC